MLTYFGTSTAYRRRSTRQSGDHGISAHFWILFGFLGIYNENGMSAHGFTHVEPYFVCINRRIGNVISSRIVYLCDVG
jgi:hypothetical protein